VTARSLAVGGSMIHLGDDLGPPTVESVGRDQAADQGVRAPSAASQIAAGFAVDHMDWARLFRVAQEASMRWLTSRAFVAVEEVSRTPS
jgi:hypothetical protein